jgi:hypothetical protein
MDPRAIAIDFIHTLPGGVDFDDVLNLLEREFHRIECQAFGIDEEVNDLESATLSHPGSLATHRSDAASIHAAGVVN